MKIRKAVATDAASVRELLRELGYPSSLALTRTRLGQLTRDNSEDLLVAETASGKIAGFISIHYIPQIALAGDFARISYFCVAEDKRSQGIGRYLEEKASQLARERGCNRIELHCHSRRREAHRFYARQGYSESPKYLVKSLQKSAARSK